MKKLTPNVWDMKDEKIGTKRALFFLALKIVYLNLFWHNKMHVVWLAWQDYASFWR